MANDAPFDPCRQWLGIDAVSLGDARKVLGLAASEADPSVVRRAAEARLSLLRAISPGPFEMARASLIKRVEEAREKVLAEIAATPGRAPAPAAGFAMPAPPSHRQAAQPAVPMVPQIPTIPTAPGATGGRPPAVPPSVPGPGGNAGGGFEPIAIRTTIYRKKTPVAGIVLTILALSAAAGGLTYYTLYGKRSRSPESAREKGRPAAGAVAANGRAKDPELDDSDADGRDESRGAAARRRSTTSDRAVSSSKPPENRPERVPPPRREPEASASPLDAVAAVDPSATMPAENPPSMAMSRPAVRPGAGADAMVAMASEEAEPAMTPPKATTGTDAAAPDGAAELAKLDTLLAEVLAAMQAQDDDTVGRLLAAAAKQVTANKLGAAAGQRVANWRHLATYYKGFLGFRQQALAAVKPGDEYEVRSQKIAVVEADDSVFKYRVAGETRTAERDKIPGGIVLAIVLSWFDPNPANDLYVGAYHLAKPESDPKLARQHWLKAEAGGADASALLPLLDDSVFARASDAGE